jgi:hypothetical protein
MIAMLSTKKSLIFLRKLRFGDGKKAVLTSSKVFFPSLTDAVTLYSPFLSVPRSTATVATWPMSSWSAITVFVAAGRGEPMGYRRTVT